MAAGIMPLAIEQGSSYLMQFKFIKNDEPLDITNVKLIGSIKDSLYDEVGFPFRFDKLSSDTVNVYLDAEVSAGIDFTKGVYDIKMIQVDGFNTTLIKGDVTITLGVTDGTSYT
jgi:hypothetical protein